MSSFEQLYRLVEVLAKELGVGGDEFGAVRIGAW